MSLDRKARVYSIFIKSLLINIVNETEVYYCSIGIYEGTLDANDTTPR